MKLIKLECPNCKAKLEVNSEMKQFMCNYCGTTTLLDDEKIFINVDGNVSHNTMKSEIQDLKDLYENGNMRLAYDKAIELHNKYPKNKDISKIYTELKESGVKSTEEINISNGISNFILRLIIFIVLVLVVGYYAIQFVEGILNS